MKKRRFLQILAFLLCLSLLPLTASAEEPGVTAVCEDKSLYAALTDALDGVAAYSADPDALRITLTEAEAAKVTALRLNNREITDLSGLEAFTALKELNIANNAPLSDLSPLASLTGLTTLTAYGNAIKDVTPILGLTALESLSLAKNKLNESKSGAENCVTEQLSALTNLRTLDLSHNVIRYTAGLNRLTALQSLNLFDNAIRDLSGLEGLANLTFLSLGENNETDVGTIANLQALDSLTALTSFNFANNHTPEITEHLSGMTNLQTLSLVSNNITDASALSGLPELRELILYGNRIESAEPLYGLSKLETLDLGGNQIVTLSGVLDENNALVWPVLRTLNIAGNWNWNFRTQPESGVLFQMFLDGDIELGYTYSRLYTKAVDWSHLPHVDADGTTYVTYDDFYARCDGAYDDFYAIRNAHNFANDNHCDEVRATAGKTYHIFDYYEYGVTAKTNIDWQGATFVIHDEDIEQKYGRYNPLILITNTVADDCVTIENPQWTIDRSTTKLDILQDTLAPLNAKGYKRYLCIAQNETKKQFIRYQTNVSNNAGEPQQDRFLIDADCNLLNEVAWNFEKITSFEIVPVPEKRGYVRDATFISNAPSSLSETPATRSGVSKPIYFNRNLQWRKSCNMEISGIRHVVTSNEICGSYSGMLNYSNSADIDTHDCALFTRKCQNGGRSTYDLVLGSSVNMRFANIEINDLFDMNRWSVMQSFYCKDVIFENCVMNRIDAHQGIYNLTVKNCTLGVRALTMTGQGKLDVSNTTIMSEQLATLRFDYGSTWRGDMYFTDCTLAYRGTYAEKILNYQLQFDADGSLHEYGYDCHMPNLYIDNLTVDNANNAKDDILRVIYNWDTDALTKTPSDYWPREMILNGVKFIHNESLSKEPRIQLIEHPAEGLDGNYIITDVRFRLNNENGEDITRNLRGESAFETASPVCVTATENNSTENRVSLYRDGVAVFEDTLLSGTYQETFSAPGRYRFTVRSSETKKGTSGEAAWEFRITGSGAGASEDWTDNGDGATHSRVNPETGKKITASHTYENGKCTACGCVPESIAKYRLTVYTDNDTKTETEYDEGSLVTVSAGDVEGKSFAYWALHTPNGVKVSENERYTFAIRRNMTLYAVYSGHAAVPDGNMIALTDCFAATTASGSNAVAFTMTRSVPDGKTVEKSGILYGNNTLLGYDANSTDNLTETGFDVAEALKDKGRDSVSRSTANCGDWTLRAAVGNNLDAVVYAMGYVSVSGGETYYTDVSAATYQALSAEQSPEVVFTNVYAAKVNGENAVAFTATHTVSAGCTVTATGILYATNAILGYADSNAYNLLNDNAYDVKTLLTSGAEGVRDSVSRSTANHGDWTLRCAVGDNVDAYVYAIAYLTVTDSSGVSATYYSDVSGVTYHNLNAAS